MIVLDTCVVSALFGNEARTPLVHRFLDHLATKGLSTRLPPAVVFELCAAQPTEEKADEMRDLIARRFHVLRFDARAAVVGARLFARAGGFRTSRIDEWKLPEESKRAAKERIKYDAEILACAIAYDATDLVTWDRGLIDLAKKLNARPIVVGEAPMLSLPAKQLDWTKPSLASAVPQALPPAPPKNDAPPKDDDDGAGV